MGAGMVIGFFAGWVWCRIVFPLNDNVGEVMG